MALSWGPRGRKCFQLRESLSEMSEISNFVEFNCGERPQGKEASLKASAVMELDLLELYKAGTYVLSVFHLFL